MCVMQRYQYTFTLFKIIDMKLWDWSVEQICVVGGVTEDPLPFWVG